MKKKLKYYWNRIIIEKKHYLMKTCVTSKFLARIYYGIINRSFAKENRTVLRGKILYWQKYRKNELNKHEMRRNIHRLEKGLIIPERKETFGQSYIMKTVRTYINNINNPEYDKPSLKWAHDILTLYFQKVKHKGIIKEAYNLFEKTERENSPLSHIPYKRTDKKLNTQSYDEFLNLCTQRASTRIFQQKDVPNKLIEEAFQAAIHSPSACNRQPYEFWIFKKQKDIDRFIKLPGGISGFEKGIPVLAFLIGDLSAFFDERDRHLIYIDGGIVTMRLILALESLGLASCVLNLPDIKEKDIDKELSLPKHKSSILALIFGYPEENSLYPYSQKKAVSTIVKYK